MTYLLPFKKRAPLDVPVETAGTRRFCQLKLSLLDKDFLYMTAAGGLHAQQVEAMGQAGERNLRLTAAGFHLPYTLPGGIEKREGLHLLTAGHIELLRGGIGEDSECAFRQRLPHGGLGVHVEGDGL